MISVLILAALQVTTPRAEAAVVGKVLDAESGRPLAGAIVTAVDARRWATANSQGRYVISTLPSGLQQIAVQAMGYAPYALRVMLPRHDTLELNVSLQRLPTQLPIVEVRRYRGDVAHASGRRSAGDERTITDAELAYHPQLAEPDFLRAVAGGDVAIAPETPGGLHVRGASADQIGYALDGVPVFNPYHVSDLMGAWNTDALSRARLSPDADGASTLSGALQLTTRTPGAHVSSRGGLSTTHARFAADGPLGVGNAGFVVSARSAFPAGVAPRGDRTFVRGESHDWLSKLEVGAAGGSLRLLLTQSADEIDIAPVHPDIVSSAPVASRNTFEWNSAAASVQWLGRVAADSLTFTAWRSSTAATGSWNTTSLRSQRSDLGVQAIVGNAASAQMWHIGLRFERPEMTYRAHNEGEPGIGMHSASPLTTAFTDVSRQFAKPLGIGVKTSTVLFRGQFYLAPSVRARWTLSDRMAISGNISRSHQFAQSLRNTESVVGYVFPADLFMGAERRGLPVAVSDEVSLSADFEPTAGIHTRIYGYAREIRGMALVAPFDDSPFLRGAFKTGRATARGAYAEAEVIRERYTALLRYGMQRLLYQHDAGSYTPAFGARESLDGGITAFPTPTTSIRLGVTAALGRRVTPATGALEWESCNLKDRGCEFAGSPRTDTTLIGAYRAPNYARIDVGVRKHMALRLGARSAELAIFGTYSNLLGRFNVLTYTLTGGGPAPIEMRPQSPLVVGLDWRF
ncbi:MAG: carboxypeptidase regulatory-like domain-containing protein [Gemmatimonadaceae bacterium]